MAELRSQSSSSSTPSTSSPTPDSLCVLLFGEDTSERARQLRSMRHCEVIELTGAESLRAAIACGKGHVLVVSGGELPEEALPSARRPPIIWLAATQPGSADVLLPPTASDLEFQECVELLGKRCRVLDELEQLSLRLQDAFERHRWRGQTHWHGPHELLAMALTDPLTGLSSRRRFDTSLHREFDRARSGSLPLSLILLDLDHFKPVNDTWGHRVGDVVLMEVAARLKHSTRATDVVCRHGGDEFAVITPGTPLASAALIADRLRVAISGAPYVHEQQLMRVGCSAGVASLPESDAGTPAELLLCADHALIAAKRAGGNQVCLSTVAQVAGNG